MENDIVEKLRELRDQRPFVGIRIMTSDGEDYWIKHPEFLWIPPSEKVLFIIVANPDGRTNHIQPRNITNIQSHDADLPAGLPES